MSRYYSEYFIPAAEHRTTMTKADIEKTPETWLSFYPHPSFVAILRSLLGKLDNPATSLWITGTYGSGKSHAALVLQKLFHDDVVRLERFFDENSDLIAPEVAQGVRDARAAETLVIYECGSGDIANPGQLVVRMERAIRAACEERGLVVPALSSEEKIVGRIRELEAFFFKARDAMQHELANLTGDIKDATQFEAALRRGDGAAAPGILADAERVWESVDTYLTPTAARFLDWIGEIRAANVGRLGKIVLLWDEFTTYLDNARGNLDTFQIAADEGRAKGFLLVPITHVKMESFFASGVGSAQKLTGRFEALPIDIPANHVFRLGSKAFKIRHADEWKRDAEPFLWSGVSNLVEAYMVPRLPEKSPAQPDDFRSILPMHPMSAFLLILLSQNVGQDVRSFFDFLRDQTDESEYQHFLREGGPEVPGRQYLTLDGLWHYFIEKPSVHPDPDALKANIEFASRKKAFGWEERDPEARVYKAALLLLLLEGKVPGVKLTEPTVENLTRAFQGDSTVGSVASVAERLSRDRNCFSIVNGRIYPLTGGGVDPSPWLEDFGTLVASPTADRLKGEASAYDPQRYDVKGFDAAKIKPADIKGKTEYANDSSGGNRILLALLFAKDREGKIAAPERAKALAEHFCSLRMVFGYCENLAFNDRSEGAWLEYATEKAYEETATDAVTKRHHEEQRQRAFDDWVRAVRHPGTRVTLVFPGSDAHPEPEIETGLSWQRIKERLEAHKGRWMPDSPDSFARGFQGCFKVPPTALQQWAKAALVPDAATGTYKTPVANFQRQGIEFSNEWLVAHPDHPLSRLAERLETNRRNTAGRGGFFSLRKVYLELRRAPYGLEKNAWSAFVLGFALRPWLSKELQWTDGKLTRPLDPDTLAEIIQKVVENDGAGEIRDEKKICKLSPEEKSFAQRVSVLFGITANADATPESVLAQVGGRVGVVTGNVPLLMLPPWVEHTGTEVEQDAIVETLQLLCEVLRTSARNAEGRVEKIKRIGLLLDAEKSPSPGVFEALKRLLSPAICSQAFGWHLESTAPELVRTASEIGDSNALRTREEISARFRETTSWLWNEVDVRKEVEEVLERWRVVRETRSLFGVEGFLPWEQALAMLRKAVFEENRVSLAVLADKWPFVEALASLLKESTAGTDTAHEIARILVDEHDAFVALFRDPARNAVRNALTVFFGEAARDMSDGDWKTILPNLGKWAELDAEAFRANAWTKIEVHLRNSVFGKLVKAWKQATGEKSPDEWSAKQHRPAETLFKTSAEAETVLAVFRNPQLVSEATLTAALKEVESLDVPDNAEIDRRFMQRFLPARYAKMKIPADALAEWFETDLGEPNGWKGHPKREEVLHEFIFGSYEKDVLPTVKKMVEQMDEKEAKNVLLNLVSKSPEAGIDLLR